MGKYRKRPIEIEAWQWVGDQKQMPVPPAPSRLLKQNWRGRWLLKTLEGWFVLTPGDWIICGIAGEFYPCKPNIFAATYEAAEKT